MPTTYKVDIACPEHMLAIEVDGKTHKTRKWKHLDARKTMVLRHLGWTVLRFWNHEVLGNLGLVVGQIRACTILK